MQSSAPVAPATTPLASRWAASLAAATVLTPLLGALTPILAVTGAVALAAPSLASSLVTPVPQAGKADRIFTKNKKTAKVEANVGVVTAADLKGIKFTERGDKNQSADAIEVVLIQWGDVPDDFTDGETYAKRGEWEKAVSSFQAAAADDDAREVVRAAARVRAIESMIAWGAADPARFADAIAEATRFLSDHGENWKVPAVRAIKARATWLSGDAAAARDGYRSLFETGKDGADGYSPLMVAEAAMSGARAALVSPETSTARELFDSAASAFAAIDSNDPEVMARAAAGAEVARMAAAESLLAKGDFAGAVRAFESALDEAKTSAGKGAAKLGLGRALLGKGENAEAEIQLGWVAGLDHTSADRRAAALLALGEALKDSAEGKGVAKSALQRVKSEYGATPSAARANELLSGL
ncbi:hypothetical protein Poly30_37730 [Planctomycetes bacterium Poly30]|uniref:Tetratricopeptide repeat protein n=1 Tax=Saltatorellus ferox TaxID=2528018 RepID=A0A518EVY0_9BACT|nr:hypothetical protein Poly30_37730 [Planctomycetes bacterium Poly30]